MGIRDDGHRRPTLAGAFPSTPGAFDTTYNGANTEAVSAVASRPYHVGYVGRKRGKRYVHGPDEILAACGGLIVHHEEIDSIFRAAIGDYGYLVRSRDLDEVRTAARYIQETA